MGFMPLIVLGIFALPEVFSSEVPYKPEDRSAPGMVGVNIWDNSTVHVALMNAVAGVAGLPITIDGPDDIRAAYRTDVDSNGILQIGPMTAVGNASIGMRVLSGLKYFAVGGASDVYFADKFGGEKFTLITTSSAKVTFMFDLLFDHLTIIAFGSSRVEARVGQATSVDVTVTDNAEVKILSGKAVSGKVVVRGSGRLFASQLVFSEATVEVHDQGHAQLNVRGERLVTKDQTASLVFTDKRGTITGKAVDENPVQDF